MHEPDCPAANNKRCTCPEYYDPPEHRCQPKKNGAQVLAEAGTALMRVGLATMMMVLMVPLVILILVLIKALFAT